MEESVPIIRYEHLVTGTETVISIYERALSVCADSEVMPNVWQIKAQEYGETTEQKPAAMSRNVRTTVPGFVLSHWRNLRQ